MSQINIPWNKYEVALLAEASIKVAQGVISRKDAVSQLSKRLRHAIIKLGVILSDTYRNENGVGLQLQSMDYCLTNGKKGLSSHSKLFAEIAQLVTDEDRFTSLLSDANRQYPMPPKYVTESNSGEKETTSDAVEMYETEGSTYKPKKNASEQPISDGIKARIFDLVDDRRQRGGHSYRISDIFDAFSSELKSRGVKSLGELRLWLAKEFPDWWVANYYVLIGKSTFNRDDVILSESKSGDKKDLICPSEAINAEKPNPTESIAQRSKTNESKKGRAIKPAEGQHIEVNRPKQKKKKPFSEQFKKKVRDRVSFLLIEGKSVVELAPLYRYFKDEFNENGIYTSESLRQSLQEEFPSWVFDNHSIKSLGTVTESNASGYEPIIPSDLALKISKFAEERMNDKTSLTVLRIFMEFKKQLIRNRIYNFVTLKKALELTFPEWKFLRLIIISLGKSEKTRSENPVSETNSKADNHEEKERTSLNQESKDACATKLEDVLLKNFARGYRLDSIIERRKLIRLYEEYHGAPCTIPIDNIDQTVKKLGIVSGIKVYFPKLMLSAETRDKISEYIQSRFISGVKYLYYVAIQKAFDSELLDSQIVNQELLKDFLRVLFPQYHYYKDYVAARSGISPDIDEEVFRFVKEAYTPVSEQDVSEALYFLPKDSIHASFTLNGNILISNNRNNERFHIDNFVISRKDIDTIINDISQTINKEEYISWNDFVVYLRTNLAHLFSDNPQITEFGIRNVLKVLLRRAFNINNNVICSVGDEITVERILRRFIRTNDTFTLLEVKELTSSFGTGIYWDQLTREAVRIDESRFVSKRSVKFDVRAIDEALEEFCPGNYISLESVTLFTLLPFCGFPWNSFLLENYVDRYSDKFKVIHNQYLQKSVRGAIVRKEAKIDTLDDLILDYLVSSKKQYTAGEALEALKEEKLIAKARYEGIEHIVEKAMLMRQNINE